MSASRNLEPKRSATLWRARAQRLGTLRLRDVSETVIAGICLLRVARALGRVSFPRLIASLGLDHSLVPASGAEVAAAQQKVRWAHLLIPIQPNCLLDSLAAAAVLQRGGRSVPVSIGVARKDGQFSAHAWLGASSEAADTYRVLWRSPATP